MLCAVQVAVFKAVRDLMGPDFHISYTISALASQFDPFTETIRYMLSCCDVLAVIIYKHFSIYYIVYYSPKL